MSLFSYAPVIAGVLVDGQEVVPISKSFDDEDGVRMARKTTSRMLKI
jgi:hypothetical protein